MDNASQWSTQARATSSWRKLWKRMSQLLRSDLASLCTKTCSRNDLWCGKSLHAIRRVLESPCHNCVFAGLYSSLVSLSRLLANRPISTPITAARYRGPATLVATLTIRARGSIGLMSPKPTVVRQTKA